MGNVKAVTPYVDKTSCNYRLQPYRAWINLLNDNDNPNANHKKKGIAGAHYPWRCFHGLAYQCELPSLGILKSRKEARLRFVEPVSISFDTFPDYARYEVIPMVWDCWPQYDEKFAGWIKRHDVRTVVFTSSEACSRIHKRLPTLKALAITEGVETDLYPEGLPLTEREIPLFLYGRTPSVLWKELKGLHGEGGGNKEDFAYRLQHAKITVALPRCDVEPAETGGQETLTQRFWEGMLSRMVMVGRAPRELTDLIGYNPVIDIDYDHFADQVRNILAHIEDYQPLVDKNREVALQMAPWEIRMKQVMEWLKGLGYEV